MYKSFVFRESLNLTKAKLFDAVLAQAYVHLVSIKLLVF